MKMIKLVKNLCMDKNLPNELAESRRVLWDHGTIAVRLLRHGETNENASVLMPP